MLGACDSSVPNAQIKDRQHLVDGSNRHLHKALQIGVKLLIHPQTQWLPSDAVCAAPRCPTLLH